MIKFGKIQIKDLQFCFTVILFWVPCSRKAEVKPVEEIED